MNSTWKIASVLVVAFAEIVGATGGEGATAQPTETRTPAPIQEEGRRASWQEEAVKAEGEAGGVLSPVPTAGLRSLETGQSLQSRPSSIAHAPPISRISGSTRLPAPSVSQNRWKALWGEIASPAFLLGSAGPALGDHLSGRPSSWRTDALGYALRVGSNAGGLLAEAGVAHGLAAASGLDLRFEPRGRGGIGPRLRHAAIGALTARTAGGARVPNVPRVVGTYVGALAQQRWEGGSIRPGTAALNTALSLGIDVTINVIRELTDT